MIDSITSVEPFLYAIGVKKVFAKRDSGDFVAVYEFFEADGAFFDVEFILS